ncbi:hypothetical protein PRIPAC_78918 [Pristionchus pacificus]|uniref:G protein-coupled receptor n=1 Tax=Pristionchus pacificus TaxID=54126 RepID=A0A2A6CJX1_PRIPA|nr:hypothetical protein PRIPAC_78918 [Pristionchus pacificus]|eukprot:PDM78525.1 G protein-coupled receptor [Pristionchus pacificus]
MSCLLANAFFTLLYIPFFYVRIGAGYCMGVICLFIPYIVGGVRFNFKTDIMIYFFLIIETFLTMTMFSAFGMMIIARHQLLIDDHSFFKMRPSMKYLSYFAVNCAMHIMTTSTVLSPIASSRDRQIIRLKDFPQLKWQTRGLNWFVFDSVASPALKDFTYYAFFIAVPLFCAFIILPFMHMLIIVMNARKNIKREQRHKMAHLRQAQTIIMQALILFICLGIPFVPAVLSTLRDNVYADSQTSICIAEMVFVSSTLLNSLLIVSRNHAYRQAIVQLFRNSLPSLRNRNISSIVNQSR